MDGNILQNNSARTGYAQTPIQTLNITHHNNLITDGAIAKKQGQHVHLEIFGNFNAEIAQYSVLVGNLLKSASNNRIHCFAFLINPTTGSYQKTVACILTPSGNIITEELIPNGSRMSLILDYMCADNVL